jgi:hypothetical protein
MVKEGLGANSAYYIINTHWNRHSTRPPKAYRDAKKIGKKLRLTGMQPYEEDLYIGEATMEESIKVRGHRYILSRWDTRLARIASAVSDQRLLCSSS